MPHSESVGLTGGVSASRVSSQPASFFEPPSPVYDGYLRSDGNVYGLASAHVTFPSTYQTMWVQYNTRLDLTQRSLGSLALIGLVFTEWESDPYYNNAYAQWWAPASIVAYGPSSGSWHAFPSNCNNTRYSYQDGDPTPGSIVQLGASYNGTTGSGGTLYSHWNIELWIDDILRYSGEWGAQFYRPGVGYSAPQSLNSIHIPGHYGDNGNTYYDDIQAGTSRGASDILAPINFDDGSFGPLVLMQNDNGVFTVERVEVA